jgi:hypothetical protein
MIALSQIMVLLSIHRFVLHHLAGTFSDVVDLCLQPLIGRTFIQALS